MKRFLYIPIFNFVVFTYPIVVTSISLDSGDFSSNWTLGATGQIRANEPFEVKELQDVCRCLSDISKSYTQGCSSTLTKYGPLIVDGICHADSESLRDKRSISDTWLFGSPPAFIENKKCQGAKSIILASSGTEKQLTLTTQASVIICPGSIDPDLQQLKIMSVSKIIIAPGAFKSRQSDITIRFSNVKEKVIIPREAFSIKEKIPDLTEIQIIEVDFSSFTPPASVTLDINTAAEIEFKSQSVVAPRVSLKLNNVKSVLFDSQAIVPHTSKALSLDLSQCQSVILGPNAIKAGRFEAKYIKLLLMKEKAVEIADSSGARAKVEHVTNMTILDEGLNIGPGADIIFNNVTLTSAGVRSIQGTGPGNLRRATFTHVKGKQLASVAMCIKTETAVVFDIEMVGKDGEVGACIEAQNIHGSNTSGTVSMCQKLERTEVICDDPRCEHCVPGTKDVLVAAGTPYPLFAFSLPSVTSSIETTISTTQTAKELFYPDLQKSTTEVATQQGTTQTLEPEDFTEVRMLMDSVTGTDFPLFKDEKPEEESVFSFLKNLKDTKLYVIIIFLVVVLLSILFAAYMIYKCCTYKKHYKYRLPQQNRLSTFHNPRTIMTPENLTDKSNTRKSSSVSIPEVNQAYDFYRRRPTATYIAHSETLELANSSCSAESQSLPCEDDLPKSHYHVAENDPDGDQSPPAYQPPGYDNHFNLTPIQHQQISAEECYLYPEDEMVLDNQNSYEYCIPDPEHLPPPPEGYIQLADDQVTHEDYHSSEDECSSDDLPHEDQHLSNDSNLSLIHEQAGSGSHDGVHQVSCSTSSPNKEQSNKSHRLSKLNMDASDDELII